MYLMLEWSCKNILGYVTAESSQLYCVNWIAISIKYLWFIVVRSILWQANATFHDLFLDLALDNDLMLSLTHFFLYTCCWWRQPTVTSTNLLTVACNCSLRNFSVFLPLLSVAAHWLFWQLYSHFHYRVLYVAGYPTVLPLYSKQLSGFLCAVLECFDC